jgi:uncharacterized protein YkwD
MKFIFLSICLLSQFSCVSQQLANRNQPPKASTVTSQPVKIPPSVSRVETGDFRTNMLAAVNKLRASGCRCGGKQMPPVPPLRWNNQLEAAAMRHANDMASNGHFDHIGTDNSEFDDRISATGYKWMEIGENIAFGYDMISTTIQGWINSTSHCKQMMSPKVDELGAAKNGKYWVQEFGKQRTW